MKATFKFMPIITLVLMGTRLLPAQPEGTKYFKIPAQELTMTDYEKDPGSPALVLFDVGTLRFNFNGVVGIQVISERHTRIKVLKKEGYEYADVTIPYYWSPSAKIDVGAVKAYTYNLENGKMVETKLEKSAILDEKVTKHRRQLKFALPNVREGSVLEYSYQITSDILFTLPDWEFRWDIPVAWSEYTTAIPEYFRYAEIAQGYDPLEVHETAQENRVYGNNSYREYITNWVQKDLPAYREEPYIAARDNLIEKIEYQLSSINLPNQITENVIPNWAQVAKELNRDEDFGSFLKKGNAVQDLVASLLPDLKTDKEKVTALHNYVKTTYQWNEDYSYYTSQSVSNLIKTRTGNSADINMLLILLLREANLDANPAILSTRAHGKVHHFYPLMNKFNHVIAYVTMGDKGMGIDAIDPMLPADMICLEDLNGEALMIKKDDSFQWVVLGENIKESTYNGVVATLTDGNLTGSVTTGHRGYTAAKMRKAIKAGGPENAANAYLKSYFNEFDLTKSTFENHEDANAALKGTLEFTSADFVEDGGDFIYVNPMLGFGLKENPFKNPVRAFPVDFAYPSYDNYQFTLNIPDGYELAEAPKQTRMTTDDASVTVDYLVETKPKQVKLNYRYSRKRVFFTPEEYVNLRSFYEQVANYCSAQIVLKKTGN